jgi:hypothetical protein
LLTDTLPYVAGSRPRNELFMVTDDREQMMRSLSREDVEHKAMSNEQVKELAGMAMVTCGGIGACETIETGFTSFVGITSCDSSEIETAALPKPTVLGSVETLPNTHAIRCRLSGKSTSGFSASAGQRPTIKSGTAHAVHIAQGRT